MQTRNNPGTRQAAALATWIVIQAIERNPNHFDTEDMAEECETCLDRGLSYAEQERYDESLNVMKNFLGKLLAQSPSIIKSDSELLEALGALAHLDVSFKP